MVVYSNLLKCLNMWVLASRIGRTKVRTSLSSTTCGCLSCLWLIISRSTYFVICLDATQAVSSLAAIKRFLAQVR